VANKFWEIESTETVSGKGFDPNMDSLEMYFSHSFEKYLEKL
jgi:hypothetical protein